MGDPSDIRYILPNVELLFDANDVPPLRPDPLLSNEELSTTSQRVAAETLPSGMGTKLSRALTKRKTRNERKVLLLGLDAAGKSSTCHFSHMQ